MSIEQRYIEVSGIRVEVVRKDIKNLHVGVYPPNGRVRVATPMHLNDDSIRLAIVSRLSWIKKQQKEFRQQDRQSDRDMVSGETHYFRGKKYRLDVIETNGRQEVKIVNNGKIQLKVRPGTGKDKKQSLLKKWYRQSLREVIPEMVAKWEKEMNLNIAEVGIKIMKTRWGSCNIEARRIWLNLELAKKPITCIEYILVHEMVHFFERHHTDRFRELMDHYLPDWCLRRDELNQSPLAYEEWKY